MQLHVYRVSLIDSEARELFREPLSDQDRFDRLAAAIRNASATIYRNTSYIFYNVDRAAVGVAGRVGRPDIVDLSRPDPTTGRLTDTREDTTEWVHFVFGGVGENYLLIQRKVDFFSGSQEGLAAILEGLIAAGLDDERYVVSVNPITSKQEFWAIIERVESVHKLSLEMIAPNPLRGSSEFAEIVEYNQLLYNAAKFSTSIENEQTGLELNPNNRSLSEQVDYVSGGGGGWSVSVREPDGRRKEYKSSDIEVIHAIEIDDDSQPRANLFEYIGLLLDRVRRLLG